MALRVAMLKEWIKERKASVRQRKRAAATYSHPIRRDSARR
jgi:hypothetical protein